MTNILLLIVLALLILTGIIQVVLLRRKGGTGNAALEADLASLDKTLERMERSFRDELAKNREEAALSARLAREELGGTLKTTVDSLDGKMSLLIQTNDQKLEQVRALLEQRLTALQAENSSKLDQVQQTSLSSSRTLREEVGSHIKNFGDILTAGISAMAMAQTEKLKEFRDQLETLTSSSDTRLIEVRKTVDEKLDALQGGSAKQLAEARQETSADAKALREEVAVNLKTFGETITGTMKDHAAAQKAQQDFFSTQLQKLTETNEDKLAAVKDVLEQRLSAIQEENGNKLDQMRVGTSTSSKDMRDEVNLSLKNFNDSVLKTMTQLSDAQTKEMETFSAQLGLLTESNQARLEALKVAVEAKLQSLQEDNAKQLDQMRATVDEKLQGTLEKRLGESFRQVSERLEQVSKGLGEMQSLATGVGDLKKVLTNVKARGTWGEVQLGNLLEQVLSPEQYEANVAPKGGSERVEFAIKLPGRTDKADEVVWLPIDAKWPVEDYQRLTEAQERGDAIASEAAILQLELRIKQCAKDISEKYLNPPKTTDFGILFLPTEGLFAEVIRRSALVEVLQVKYRVIVAGPTTLWSILSSLQMGFRTLAIQKRSSEVWTLLAAVKTEWGKYGAVLTKVQKKLQEASNTMEEANKRNRAVGRKLRDVQDLPTTEASSLLMLDSAISIDGDDDVEAEDPGDVGGAS
jgi:DNA recombination protein RmuC